MSSLIFQITDDTGDTVAVALSPALDKLCLEIDGQVVFLDARAVKDLHDALYKLSDRIVDHDKCETTDELPF